MKITDKIFYGVVAAACLYYAIGVIALGIAILRDYQETKNKERIMKNESATIRPAKQGLSHLLAVLAAQKKREKCDPRPAPKPAGTVR